MPGTGTIIVDFGPSPGAFDVSVDVTGQAAIAAGALVDAWVLPLATADHSLDEHIVDPPNVTAHSVVAGQGFTISAVPRDGLGLAGKYTVAWVWN